MAVSEGLVYGLVQIAVVDLVDPHARKSSGHLGQLATQILALLVGALGGGGQRGQFGVDLVKEFGEFAEVESAGVVTVILLEQLVEPSKVVGGLREALLHAGGHVLPFPEREVQFFGVLPSLPRDGAEEGDDMVRDVVLHGRAIANGIHVTQRCSDEAEVGIRLKSMFVILRVELVGKLLAKFGPSCVPG